jgi:cytochrome c553
MKLGILPLFLLGNLAIAEAAAAQDAGRQMVTQMCAVCHGLNGIGVNPEVPNLAGESSFYLEKQLKAFRSGERKHEQMTIIAQGLKDEDIKNVTDWYSSVKVTAEMPP